MSGDDARFGVDTGGTFTDVVAFHRGRLFTHKILSTPDDPSRAIASGVEALEISAGALVHGTTVATNALLERRGSHVAFVTTAGFEDLLFLRRQNRPYLYAFEVKRSVPLVGKDASFGVHERVLADGRVETALDEGELERLVDSLRDGGYEAVAISFLHAYANPEHEARVAAWLRDELEGVFITASHEVLPQFREYERASTTALNAFVGPIMSRYIGRLTDRLSHLQSLEILQSNGGRASTDYIQRFPVHTVLSGPAGGVVGAWSVARELGIDRIITLDMGGTSTDVSLVDGELTWTREAEIDGLPVHVAVTDIETVGAGGGSIAYVDAGGALRVGPRSAGASPGPAAYGRGGAEMTVTDAHLLLGRLRAAAFLAGEMQLDEEASRAAALALASGLDEDTIEALSRDVLQIANVTMVRAIKTVSVERGHDPSEFALVAFGGAGGLHACEIAAELDIQKVVIPRTPGLLSAFGMLRADILRVVSTGVVAPVKELVQSKVLEGLMDQLRDSLDREMGAHPYETRVEAELRYRGQSFELTVPVPWTTSDITYDPSDDFQHRHRAQFGYTTDRPVEIVSVRMVGVVEAPRWKRPEVAAGSGVFETHQVHFDEPVETRVYRREDLDGVSVSGPAIITEYSATTVIPAGWTMTVSRGGHLVLEAS